MERFRISLDKIGGGTGLFSNKLGFHMMHDSFSSGNWYTVRKGTNRIVRAHFNIRLDQTFVSII